LDEDAVDLLEVDGASFIANGFQERAEAEVAEFAEQSVGGADDEVDGLLGEGVVTEADAVQLVQEEFFEVVRCEFLEQGGVGNAAPDVLIDGEREVGEECWMTDEDEVVVFGKILQEQAKSAKALHVQQVSVVDKRHEGFGLSVELEGVLDKGAFAVQNVLREVEFQGDAQDAKDVAIGVQGA